MSKADPFALPVNMRAYAHTISIHCPNTNDVDMQARCEIARIRDEASAGLNRCSEFAEPLLQGAVKLAVATVYSAMPTQQIVRRKAAAQLALDTARIIERVVRSDG